MKTAKYILGAGILALGLSSCSEDEQAPVTPPLVNQTHTVEVSEENWTYMNLESGEVVGTSVLGDEQTDAEWKNRKDWDIAFCGDLIRTNSGTSGNGQGGLQVLDQAYESVKEAPYAGYATDRDDNEIWK